MVFGHAEIMLPSTFSFTFFFFLTERATGISKGDNV